MRILLINNGTKYLKELLVLLNEGDNIVVDGNLDYQNLEQDFDLVVLSGGHNCSIIINEGYYQKEIEFLKKTKIPVLGICLGAELIAYTFGAKLEHLENEEKGFINVKVLQPNTIFDGVYNFRVFESHKWVISQLSPDLFGLAKSKDGFEVIKHKDFPLYGFQFHPEMFKDQTVGANIFHNLLNFLNINA